MDVMGWSNSAMVKRYAHVTARVGGDMTDRLNTFFWTANEAGNETGYVCQSCLVDREGPDHQGVCAGARRW